MKGIFEDDKIIEVCSVRDEKVDAYNDDYGHLEKEEFIAICTGLSFEEMMRLGEKIRIGKCECKLLRDRKNFDRTEK